MLAIFPVLYIASLYLIYFILFLNYLFIYFIIYFWLRQVLVATCGIFVEACGIFPCGARASL